MRRYQTEEMRLLALRQISLLDTSPSESFDRISRMASKIFNLPIAAVSLTDQDRQWFKSRVGIDHWEIPREQAPCSEVAETAGLLVIPDLLESPGYCDSPLAASGIRFYAGAPLVTRDGYGLGAMCVLGTEPRAITPDEERAIGDLAAMVMAQIELQHAFGRVEPSSGLPNRHQLSDDLGDEARDRPSGIRSFVHLDLATPSRLQDATRVLGPGTIDDLVRDVVAVLLVEGGPIAKLYQVGIAQLGWIMTHSDELARDRDIAVARARFAGALERSRLPALADPAVGIAPFCLGENAAGDVLRAGHNAALDARNIGELVGLYSEETDNAHRRRFRLLPDMQAALLSDNQLSLVYQPRINLSTERCVAVEALLRWSHPALGAISPGEFIPLVEQTNLARQVTEWVLKTAIRQAQEWRQLGLDVPISINVSVTNLEETDFPSRLSEQMAAAGLPPHALEIEVTESAVIRDGTRVGEALTAIRAADFKVAIDDFGTGYSSLSYLQDLPADIIKIDQSFVRNLSSSEKGRTLVQSMIALAKGLDFHVVAEGIEDETALAFLRDNGCDEGQGFLMSRPVSPAGFVSWLEHWRPRHMTKAA